MVKLYNKDKHYDKMVDCWKAQNHWIIPAESLSEFGLVFEKGEEIVAFSFVYLMSNSKLAQLAWTTTNPSMGLKERHAAVNLLVDSLIEIAKIKERSNILCFSSSSGLNKILNKKGLVVNRKHDLLVGSL